MNTRSGSLLSTLLRSLFLPGIVAAVIGVFIVYDIVKEEYDELQDIALTSKAHLLLQVITSQRDAGGHAPAQGSQDPLLFEQSLISETEELTLYWVLDDEGTVIFSSTDADESVLLARVKGGIGTALGYRIVEVSPPETSLRIVVATPMEERNETILEVLFSVITGFFLLGVFVAFAAYRAIKRSTNVIADLSAEIETKDAHDLTPIKRENTFAEFEPAIDTVDMLMARLEAALSAERSFATNAAHELRTPVAISIAHVQRLQAKLTAPETRQDAVEIEQGLKRLTRLIERLLQMSRAQSGLGVTPVQADIVPVINLLLRELRDRVPSPEMLVITPPQGVWMSKVDPDAVGIMLNNLFDNAIRHQSGDGPLTVDASQTGQITITNDCAPLCASDLENLKRRYDRGAATTEGFGLGLSIVKDLCDQSGSTLDLASPPEGKQRGFVATLTLKGSELS